MFAPINSPVTIPLVALMIGIIWQAYAFNLLVPSSILALFLLRAVWQGEYSKVPPVLLGCFFFLAGAWNYKYHEENFRSFYQITAHRKFDITGEVKEIQHYASGKFCYCITIALHTINDQPIPWSLTGKKIKIWTQEAPHMSQGDILYGADLYVSPVKRENKLSLLRNNLVGICYLYNPSFTIVSSPSFSVSRWLSKQQQLLRTYLKTQLTSSAFTLFDSLFLGLRQAGDEYKAIKHRFQQWGIVHYLARSGLHLVMISFLLHLLLTLLPLAWEIKNVLLLFLIVFYALATQSSISFVRALILFFLSIICSLAMLAPHRLHLIQLTGLIILVINPFELFFLDFQLSFALTFFIAIFSALAKKY